MRFARSAASVALVLLGTGCDAPLARVEVELAGPAGLSPLVFHGNCLAGYELSLELRLRETRGVAVVLGAVDYRIRDEASGAELASEQLDAAALDARYGPEARLLAARGARIFRVGARADRGAGPVRVAGSVSGDDANGHRIRAAFDLQGDVRPEGEAPGPDAGGACGIPPA